MASIKDSDRTETVLTDAHLREPFLSKPKISKKETAIKQAADDLMLKPHPLQEAGLISSLMFLWVNPFLWLGNRTSLEQKMMPDVPKDDRVETNEQEISNSFNKIGGIGKTVASIYKWAFLKCAFLMFITQACYCSLALFMYLIIKELAEDKYSGDEKTKRFGMWFGLVIGTQLLGGMLTNYITLNLTRIGIRVKSSVIFTVYKKILRVSVLNPSQHTEGSIVNYVQSDCQKIEDAVAKFSLALEAVWQILLGFAVSIYLIHLNVVALVVSYALLTFCTLYLYKYIIKYEIQFLVAKDKKVQLLKNVIKNVKYIKQKVWENYYHAKLYFKREDELGALSRSNVVFSIVYFLNWINPTTALIVTILCMIYFKSDTFHAAEILSFMKILTTILKGMANVPVCIQFFLELRVSLQRLNLFLDADEIKADYLHQRITGDSPFAIKLEDGNFYWNKLDEKMMAERKKRARAERKKIRGNIRAVKGKAITNNENLVMDPTEYAVSDTGSVFSEAGERSSSVFGMQSVNKKTLNRSLHGEKEDSSISFQSSDMDLAIQKGKLTMIFGDIGAGKSSLFYALLGEMCAKFENPKPNLQIEGSLGYMGQKAWLMARSIRENIILDLPFDQERFDRAIHLAAMKDDLDLFPERENRVLAENGDNVSGGQKTRIELARMIYQK